MKEFANESFGVWHGEKLNVELLFSKEVREDVLNYHFHSTQEFVEKDSSEILVKFCASGEEEICWNLFKWGDSVKIIALEKLKEKYLKTLNGIRDIYKK